MKNYANIINKGGDALRKLNDEVRDRLDNMELSEKAREIIASTDINIMAECFGELNTAEEVEAFVFENYTDRFYIVDVNGVTHGEADTLAEAEARLGDIVSAMEMDGKTAEEIESLELEIIGG